VNEHFAPQPLKVERPSSEALLPAKIVFVMKLSELGIGDGRIAAMSLR
jgi:hypothetical protein